MKQFIMMIMMIVMMVSCGGNVLDRSNPLDPMNDDIVVNDDVVVVKTSITNITTNFTYVQYVKSVVTNKITNVVANNVLYVTNVSISVYAVQSNIAFCQWNSDRAWVNFKELVSFPVNELTFVSGQFTRNGDIYGIDYEENSSYNLKWTSGGLFVAIDYNTHITKPYLYDSYRCNVVVKVYDYNTNISVSGYNTNYGTHTNITSIVTNIITL